VKQQSKPIVKWWELKLEQKVGSTEILADISMARLNFGITSEKRDTQQGCSQNKTTEVDGSIPSLATNQ